jgi:hypothetical protein
MRLRIQDVNPGRPDARHDQVTTLYMRMRGLQAEARAASVPAEMMQFVVASGKVYLTDEPVIFRGAGIEIDHAHGVELSIRPDVEQRDVSEAFGACIAMPGEG